MIGDIHGCIHTLVSLYRKLYGVDGIYAVGDLIDRGKYSRQVVQFCIDKNIKPVKGNHEDMMVKSVERTDKYFGFLSKDKERYYFNGGRETQDSYNSQRVISDFNNFKKEVRSSGHFEYLKNLPLKYEFEKVLISHAGVIGGGDDYTILWNRKKPAFLNKLQIYGHTPLQEIEVQPNYYANIDTGCVYKNKLSAIIVDTKTGVIEEIVHENFNNLDLNN